MSEFGSEKRIIVEIPGISDVNAAISLIGDTPVLEFKEPAKPEDLVLTDEQQKILDQTISDKIARRDEALRLVSEGKSFNELAVEYSEDQGTRDKGGDLGYVKRGAFLPEFEAAIFDELAIGEITKEAVKTEIGWHIIRKDDERGEGADREVKSSHILFIEPTAERILISRPGNTQLSGKHLKRASVVFDPNTQVPQVSLEFNEEEQPCLLILRSEMWEMQWQFFSMARLFQRQP